MSTKRSMMKALPKFPPRESHVAWQSLPRKRSCGCPHNLPTLCHLWTSLRFWKKGWKKASTKMSCRVHVHVFPLKLCRYMGKISLFFYVFGSQGWIFLNLCPKEKTKFYGIPAGQIFNHVKHWLVKWFLENSLINATSSPQVMSKQNKFKNHHLPSTVHVKPTRKCTGCFGVAALKSKGPEGVVWWP